MGIVQTGLISPSKLRMKLMGHQRKKDGSSSNSARTSPSKLEDSEFVKNGLLASSLDFGEPGQLVYLTILMHLIHLKTSVVYVSC